MRLSCDSNVGYVGTIIAGVDFYVSSFGILHVYYISLIAM